MARSSRWPTAPTYRCSAASCGEAKDCSTCLAIASPTACSSFGETRVTARPTLSTSRAMSAQISRMACTPLGWRIAVVTVSAPAPKSITATAAAVISREETGKFIVDAPSDIGFQNVPVLGVDERYGEQDQSEHD